MNERFNKLDQYGNYTKFPGITVVCHLQQHEKEKWIKFHEFLSSLKYFPKYYSLLPVDSYHMTIKDLFVVNHFWSNDPNKSTEQLWSEFLLENMLSLTLVHHICLENKFSPIPIIKEFYFERGIGFDLELNDQDLRKAEVLRNKISGMLDIPNNAYQFHMTIGYKFKREEPENKPNLEEDLKKIEIYFKKKFSKPHPLTFDSAKLCYFRDMKKFVPIEDLKKELK